MLLPFFIVQCYNHRLGNTPPSRKVVRVDLGLKDKSALVSGGASGIGAAIVKTLALEGARVAFVDQNEEAGAQLLRKLSAAGRLSSFTFIHADLTREADCERSVAETLRIFGRLDVLVNNAGINDGVGLEESPAAFMTSLQKNLFHIFALTHFAVEALKESRGAIINIGSKVAVTGQGHTSGYAAAKGGINALTREWATALARHGVRVNAVVPAECDTPQYRRWFASQSDPGQAQQNVEALIPLESRMTTPDEIAAAVAMLASPRSSHTTGQFLFVDGGYTHLDRALASSKAVTWKGI